MKNITLSILALLVIGLAVPTHSAQAFLWFGDDAAEEEVVAEDQSVFMQATLVANDLLTVAVAATDTVAWNVKTVFEKRAEFQKKFEVTGESEFHDDAFFNKLAKAKTLKVTGDATFGNATEDNVTIDGKIKRTLGKVYIKDGLRVTGEFQLDTATITSDNIENETILSKDILDGKLQGKDFKDATITDGKLDSTYLAYENVITVVHDGADSTSGTTLVNTITGITDASASNQYLVRIGPGTYDLGTTELAMIPYVDIEGLGEDVTTITSDPGGSTVGVFSGADNAELRHMTIKNTGGSSTAAGIHIDDTSPSFKNVTITVTGGTGTINGFKIEENAGTTDVALEHVTINATASGTNSTGMLVLDGATVTVKDSIINVAGGSTDNRGIEVQNTASVSVYDSEVYDSNDGTSARTVLMFNSSSIYLQNTILDSFGEAIKHGNAGSTVEIHHSSIHGDVEALDFSTTATINIANTQLDGTVTNSGGATLTCVGTYDENFAALGTSCI